ncbi:MAG TPA: beta-propeller fold lactonase family protein [Kofleriaceae bacterium]|nr:beta-propeller fold lactonase family protein [Kofleriaceae bacterium]
MSTAAIKAHADTVRGPEDSRNPFDAFLYVLGAPNNQDGPASVDAYGRQKYGGKLVRIGRTMTGGINNSDLAGLQANALASDGHYVFAVNTGNNTISSLRINRGGDLTLTQNLSSGGLRPVSIAIHENHLYVANAGQTPVEDPGISTVVAFGIRPDGSLARLPCAPAQGTPGELFNVVGDLAINPSGTTLMLAGLGSNQIDGFSIDRAGCLTKRKNVGGGGGAFSVTFRPGTNDAVITRALPELFGDEQAPGVGSFKVGENGTFREVSTYIAPNQSDSELRDPCWLAFAKDNVHFWTSSFIPRSLNAFSLDPHTGALRRLSEYNPLDFAPGAVDPDTGGPVFIGSLDITTDTTKTHLYQLREFTNPDVLVPGSIHTFEFTGNWSKDAGLREVQVTPLPDDLRAPTVTSLIFVDRIDR